MRSLLNKFLKKRTAKSTSPKKMSQLKTMENGRQKKEDQLSYKLSSFVSEEEEQSSVVDILIKMGETLKITRINSSLQGQYRTLCHINHMLCEQPVKIQSIQIFLLSKSSDKVDFCQEELRGQKEGNKSKNNIQYFTFYSNGLIFQFYSVRALLWKISLQYLPPSKNKWVSSMESTLLMYQQKICEHILEIISKRKVKKECALERIESESQKKKRKASDHPLNNLKDSKWKTFFDDKQLWTLIEKDTTRTKPNCKFFREQFQIDLPELKEYGVLPSEVHLSPLRLKTYYYDCVTRIIYIFLRTNPEFVYSQGMNQLAALIFYCFANKNSEYFRRVAESDAYFCFEKIIKIIFKLPIPGFFNGEKYSRFFLGLLKKVDLRLYEQLEAKPDTLNSLKILSFKWFNSFFLTEYDIDETLILWDGFIAVLCKSENCLESISFQDLLLSVGLAIVHLNRRALSEGQNPLLIFAKLPHPPQTLLEKALSLYRIFHQFFQ